MCYAFFIPPSELESGPMRGLTSAEILYPINGFLDTTSGTIGGNTAQSPSSPPTSCTSPSPPSTLPSTPLPTANATPEVQTVMTNGHNVIASILPLGSKPLDSYAKDYLLKLHPSVFPNGKGARPEKMSPIQYYRILMERTPMSQFGHNVGLLFDMFDQWQRHEVNTQAGVLIKGSPHVINQLNNLSQVEVQAALDVVGKSGSTLERAKSKLSSNSKVLLSLLRRLGSRIPGSPQAKLALRSKAMAAPIVFGSATVMANLCASEVAAYWTFKMGSPDASYSFDIFTGEPDNKRPPKTEALRWALHNA